MRDRHRAGVGALALILVGAVLVAAATGSAFGLGKPTGAQSPAAATKVKLPRKTIGIMGPVDAAEVIKLVNDAAERAAKTLGWKVIRVDPGGDPAKMASGMTSLVNANVDAIVLTTMEPSTIASGLRAAARKKIPVIDTHTLTQSSKLFAGEYFLPPAKEFNLLLARMKKDVKRGAKIATINLPQFLNAKIAGDQIKAAARKQGWQIVAIAAPRLRSFFIRASRRLNSFAGGRKYSPAKSGDDCVSVCVSITGIFFCAAARRPLAIVDGSIVVSTIASTFALTRLVMPDAIFAGSPPGSTRITFQPSVFAARSAASFTSLITSAASTGPMIPIVFRGSFTFAAAAGV